MNTYILTAFKKDGKKVLDETFEATNNEEAKALGMKRLKEADVDEHTHRCVTSDGKLILFHR